MENTMTKTTCPKEVHELSFAELELVSGGLIHEATHIAASPTHAVTGGSFDVGNVIGLIANGLFRPAY
jgi:hypothetical protein